MDIIIVGCGRVGRTITKQLSKEGHNITAIDVSKRALEKIGENHNVMTIKGNGATFDTLDEARIKDCDLIIAVTEADELNLYTCLIAKNAGVQRTIARVRNPEYTKNIPRLKDELKVSRLMILAKEVKKQFLLIIHPHSVHTIKIDGKKISHDTTRSVSVYLMVYMAITLFSILIVSLDGYDFTTNVTSVLATLNNVGPGFSKVGAVGNYSIFSILSKLVLCFDMIAGRLEIYPLLLMFMPKAWKK